jgi:GNAT superfamily N-acetyltransferase
MKAWHRLTSKAREAGLPYTLQLLAERLVPKLLLDIRVVYLSELDLGGALSTTHKDQEIHLAESDEFEHLVQHHDVLGGMRQKLGSGVQLWVLDADDEVDAFMWLNPDVIQPSHWVRLELAQDEIAGVFLWVAPERRGTGLGPRMNRHISHECARAGYSRIVSTVDAWNRNSLRADEKVGYKRIGKILVLRVLGFGGLFFRRRSRLGWWTKDRPLTLPVREIEDALRRTLS